MAVAQATRNLVHNVVSGGNTDCDVGILIEQQATV